MNDGMSENHGRTPETSQAHASADHGTSDAGRHQSRHLAAVLSGIAHLFPVAAIIYFTYYFTVFFSTKAPEPAQVPESVHVATKKTEELRAQERRLLSTYGYTNSALKTIRIPVDRAMELIAAESNQPSAHATPAPEPAATVAAPKPGTAAPAPTSTSTPAPVLATAAPAAPVGMAPDILYRAVCIACHDVDGKGGVVRKAMPVIPDFTDPKWQATRTDAELQHSILEGKGQLMLPMKDKFALAKTDPKRMVAFIRGFQPGGPPPSATPAPAPTAMAAASPKPNTNPTPTANSAPKPAVPGTPASTAAPVAAPTAGSSSAALASSAPLPPEVAALLAPPAPVVTTPASSPSSSSPTAVPSAETEAKLQASAEIFRVNCIVCHGPDGRGALVRAAMPVIPDFTARAWQTTKNTAQLSISILDGKGTLMPPWRSKVTPIQARDLAMYVRHFGPADLLATEVPATQFGNRFRDLKKQWDELDQQVRSLLVLD